MADPWRPLPILSIDVRGFSGRSNYPQPRGTRPLRYRVPPWPQPQVV